MPSETTLILPEIAAKARVYQYAGDRRIRGLSLDTKEAFLAYVDQWWDGDFDRALAFLLFAMRAAGRAFLAFQLEAFERGYPCANTRTDATDRQATESP